MSPHRIEELQNTIDAYRLEIKEQAIKEQYYNTVNAFEPYKMVEANSRIITLKVDLAYLEKLLEEEKAKK